MDGANINKTRKFPSYTLAQLKAEVANGTASQAVQDEVSARESGKSVQFVVPQVKRFGA